MEHIARAIEVASSNWASAYVTGRLIENGTAVFLIALTGYAFCWTVSKLK